MIDTDVLVIGGGFAGLSAAIQAARLNRSVVVLDDHTAQLYQQTNRNYAGILGGCTIVDLREIMRLQALALGHVSIYQGCVVSVEKSPGSAGGTEDQSGFVVWASPLAFPESTGPCPMRREEDIELTSQHATRITQETSFHGRSVIWATGVAHLWPEFPGSEQCIGRSLFWCSLCDGMEAQKKHVTVLGYDQESVEFAVALLPFGPKTVTVLTGKPSQDFTASPDLIEKALDLGIILLRGTVKRWNHDSGKLWSLEIDQTSIRFTQACQVVFSMHEKSPRTALLKSLGVELDAGYVRTTNEQVTNVPHLYAAGDCCWRQPHQISAATATGARAAAAANYHLLAAEREL